MFFGWNDVMAQWERYADLRREAEQERLVRQVLAGHPRRARLWRQALTWLGQRLITWGCRLQERYGTPVAGIPPSACQPTPANQ